MGSVGRKRQWGRLVGWFGILFQVFLLTECSDRKQGISKSSIGHVSSPPVILHKSPDHVVVDNGIVKITFSTPQGMITGIQYNGIDNILEEHNVESNRGYWDIVWVKPEQLGNNFDKLEGTDFNVITQNADQVELSFTKTWNPSLNVTGPPLNIDKRYIILRGVTGFYSYGIYERLEGWRDMILYETRIAFKLQRKLFRYMAVSDKRQRIMPTAEDRLRGTPLAYPEAVRLTNPSRSALKGEVDDKYQYSAEDKDNRVHGWICSKPAVGFWVITPSTEFRVAGPVKQDLTSHAGPVSLAMFSSTHYAGKSLGISFRAGEPWKKVFGPVFIYLNTVPAGQNPLTLWPDAKKQMMTETEKWPYNFPRSKDYPYANARGAVSGRLLVRDRYIDHKLIVAASAYVGLAPPGDVGSWQTETKGYQFWTKTDANGLFLIKNVRAGNYSLYAWVPGFIGDYKYEIDVNIGSGSNIRLGDLKYAPPRNGATLWEIGIPDRTAAEFYVPGPNPTLMNQLYDQDRTERFRQYGLWDRYTDLYPRQDLVYDVDVSIYQRNWFFAHVNRNVGNKTYVPTTWKILFDLQNVENTGKYTLQLALASATNAELQVRINDQGAQNPHFTTGLIGRDNAIARHGIHGLYSLYSVYVPGSLLQNGRNIIFLRQSRGGSPFTGIMYDYIRLEQPSATN